MSGKTAIQWCDSTWNPVVGCERVSAGCDNCYAKQLHDMRHNAWKAGKRVPALYAKPFESVQMRPHKIEDPLHWRKPRRVFVNSMSDLFHKDVSDDFLDRVFAAMALAPQHTFQILTKRPARMGKYMRTEGRRGLIAAAAYATGLPLLRADGDWPLPNVWLGTSVENQACADKRIPMLMATPAAVRFLSCEPLLGPIEIGIDDIASRDIEGRYIDWIIVGGESGPRARPCLVEWIEEILAECDEFNVPVFVKQLGAVPIVANDDDSESWPGASLPLAESYEPQYQGELAPLELCDKKGGDPSEWPERLRVRQWPDDEIGAIAPSMQVGP